MLDAIFVNENAGQPYGGFSYEETIEAAQKVNWRIEDIIGGDKTLDFSKPFMPEYLARVNELTFLSDSEKLLLNQIRGHAYLSIFGVVEEFILPFVLDHIRPSLNEDDFRVRAILQFAGEEAKHIQLFKRFCEEFRNNFATPCGIIGPASEIRKAILSHQPLTVALLILQIEWMTQRHYVNSVKDDGDLDPLFSSLLKHHWLEEAQHAKLDTLMVEVLAKDMSAEEIEKAMDEYFEIGAFLDAGFGQQTLFDLEAFEGASGRKLDDEERDEFIEVQHQANRWTYIGSGMTHAKFLETLGKLNPEQRKRVEDAAPLFS